MCHVLIAGPPCPPFSKMGRQDAFEDPRASVFWRCVDIVIHQAKTGSLLLFVLENVDGLRHCPKGASHSPCDTIMKELREGLTASWSVSVIPLNSLDYGLPQRRPRTYIVGHRKSVAGDSPPAAPQCFDSTVSLHKLIETGDVTEHTQNSDLQTRNLKDWKVWYTTTYPEHCANDDLAVVDISRTPSDRTSWCSSGTPPGIVQCLTAHGPNLHVFGLHSEPIGRIDRRLRNAERAKLQGFASNVHKLARDTVNWKRFTGNAMSVPVIGSILATELTAMLRCVGPEGLVNVMRPCCDASSMNTGEDERCSTQTYPSSSSQHQPNSVSVQEDFDPLEACPPSAKRHCRGLDEETQRMQWSPPQLCYVPATKLMTEAHVLQLGSVN